MEENKIKALISLLDDTDTEIVDQIQSEILSQGDAIIPYLEKEWESNFNPIVQERIESLIHLIQFNKLKSQLLYWNANEQDDLLKGMWLVLTYQYPDYPLEKLVEEIEQMYFDLWVDLHGAEEPREMVKALNEAFFNKYHFAANTKNFHSPNNTMLNMVLESKKGNPISLCTIYLILAQKLGMPVYGVNLPNLFVLTFKNKEEQFYINVFNKGLVFNKNDIEKYIQQLKLSPKEHFFNPCSNLDIVLRSLRNLVLSFEKLGDLDKLEEIRDLIHALGDSE